MGGRAGGRPRRPTALLKLEGGYRDDRHGKRKGEPQPRGEPQRPVDLSPGAAEYWDQIVPHLVAIGVAKRADGEALVALCEAWVRYHDLASCWAKADKKTRLAMVPRLGQTLDAWLRLAGRFGLTPADRARLQVEEPDKGGDEFESMLA